MSLLENEDVEASSPSDSHASHNNNNNNNDDYLLLSKFFDRIGIKEGDRILLMDDEGIVPSEYKKILDKHAIKFTYLIPTFQNPSGRTLS